MANPPNVPAAATAPRLHADYPIPTTTLVDWASYGDAYGTFVVVNVYQSEIPKGSADRGEGLLIGKTIVVEIKDLLWLREGATSPPASISFETIGWTLVKGEQQPVLVNASPELVIGKTYAGVFSSYTDGWSPLADDTLAMIGTEGILDVPTPATALGFNPGEALMFSNGKSPAEVAAEIARTSPVNFPPGSEKLDPIARFEAVKSQS